MPPTADDWTCPFCQKPVLIVNGVSRKTGSVDSTLYDRGLALPNVEGQMSAEVVFTACPDPKCRRTALDVRLYPIAESGKNNNITTWRIAGPAKSWQLVPPGTARPFPEYIPAAIREDYEEACAIRDLSPKASATLARRCLQGMIRDFFQVKAGRLVDEIDGIKDKVQPEVWDAMTAVRHVGNIGAHMEKDINVIVDVDPGEAAQLIALIEMLLREWYVARQDRRDRLAGVKAIADAKAAAKSGASGAGGTP